VVKPEGLLTFPYEYPSSDTEVSIDTDEFTAVCPWTGLPDFGTLVITYAPGDICLELKSVKYYLLAYRSVGIVQEHAANRILNDLVAACKPRSMTLTLDYNTRGGLHTVVTSHYPAS
jgi:7-cyano-7-deazaguanine reductase